MDRRAKLGASDNWFARKRGGLRGTWRKDNGWRSGPEGQEPGSSQGSQGTHRPCPPTRHRGKARCDPDHEAGGEAHDGQDHDHGLGQQEQDERPPEATLKVPFTVGSVLKNLIQRKDDEHCRLMNSRRDQGCGGRGNKLIHILGKNDPWSARQTCDDSYCVTCISRTWIREQHKTARKNKEKVPAIMVKPGSNMCRREGINYSLQFMGCLREGVDTRYNGESSRLARQCHQEHQAGVDQGSTGCPLVVHSIKQHGGLRPAFLAVITRVEPNALYRACRESVQIANQPTGPRNMNRCQEWGKPRVPILVATGGDGMEESKEPWPNPRPEWSTAVLERLKEGRLKRIKYWYGELGVLVDVEDHQHARMPRSKKQRRDQDHEHGSDMGLTAELAASKEESLMEAAGNAVDPMSDPKPEGGTCNIAGKMLQLEV